MGIKPSTIPADVRRRMGLKLAAGGRALPTLGHALQGFVWLRLDCDPPTATHHDKRIITDRRGRRRLADSAALTRARELLLSLIRERPDRLLVPLLPPVAMHVWFTFRAERRRDQYHIQKPDMSNLVKSIEDVLVLRGYLVDDSQVAVRREVKLAGPVPGISLYLRSIRSDSDDGGVLTIPPGSQEGVILPAPWQVIEDMKAIERAGRRAWEEAL